MSAENPNSEESKIVTDEDWKNQVKAEDSALDQKMQDEKASGPEQTMGMPPASFMTLTGMFSTQAMVSLGIIPNPMSGKAEVQLSLARHFIDMLGVLEEKTKGNLDTSEEAALTDSLHQLRMAFMQQSQNGAETSPENQD